MMRLYVKALNESVFICGGNWGSAAGVKLGERKNITYSEAEL